MVALSIKVIFNTSLLLLFPKYIGIKEYAYLIFSTIIVNLLINFADLGIPQYLLISKKITRNRIHTTFWMILASSIMATTLVNVLPTIFDTLNKYQTLIPYIKILSIGIIPTMITGYLNSLFMRELDSKKIAIASLISETTSFIIVVMTINSLGIYSLAIYNVSIASVGLFITLFLTKYRPSFIFKGYIVKEVIRFGTPLISSRLIEYTNLNAPKLYTAAFLGPYYMGILALGMKIISTSQSFFRPILKSLLMPVLSKANREYPERLSNIFFKIKKLQLSIVIPLFILLNNFKESIFSIYLNNNKWFEINEYISLICILGIILSLNYLFPPLLVVKGTTKLKLYISITKFILNFILFVAFARYGLKSIFLVYFIIEIMNFLFYIIYSKNILKLDYKYQFNSIKNILYANIIIVIISQLIISMVANQLTFLGTLSVIITCLSIYIFTLLLMDKDIRLTLIKLKI